MGRFSKVFLIALLTFVGAISCGKTDSQEFVFRGLNGQNGTNGTDGANGVDGENGSDGEDGLDGQSVTITVASSGQCPTGGIVVSLGTASHTICNGAQGAPGEDGEDGEDGSTGPAGPAGTSFVQAVPLCSGSSEFGLIIGNTLYAVYHQELSSGKSNTFLSAIAAGNYVTTDGTGCTFSVSYGVGSVTVGGVTYPTTSVPPTSGGPTPLAGQCSVVKKANFNKEQQFRFQVSGMTSYTSYTLEVTFSNGGIISKVDDSNGGTETYANPLWTIAPQNQDDDFEFYAKHSSTTNAPEVVSAKVKQGGKEMSCSVQN